MTRNGYIKAIHTIAYRDLKLDEETYRSVVLAANSRNKTSCADLNEKELELVLSALQKFKIPVKTSDKKTQAKIARLMDLLGWDWSQTARFCKRLTGFSDTRQCDWRELNVVITAMVKMVEQNHDSGKRRLSQTELFEFLRHTRAPGSTDRFTIRNLNSGEQWSKQS